jgi:hypothetical protein
MPIKYKEDTVNKDRMTGKTTTQRFYVKNLSSDNLWKEFLSCRTPKLKQKFRNELVSRKVTQEELVARAAVGE